MTDGDDPSPSALETKPRVGFLPLHRTIVSERGSEYVWAINLARAASRVGFSCAATCGYIDSEATSQLTDAGVKVRSLGVTPAGNLRTDLEFYTKLLLERPRLWPNCDIVHHVFPLGFGHGFNPTLIVSPRKPVVIGPILMQSPESTQDEHEAALYELGAAPSMPTRPAYPGGILAKLYTRTLMSADHLLFDCEETRSLVTEAVPGAAATPYTFLPTGGVDSSVFDPALRSKEPHDHFRVGTLCFLRPRKHVETLVQSAASLRSLDVEFLIGGEGPTLPALRKQVHELDVEDKVRFLGRIPRSSVPKFMASLDVYCMPDRINRAEVASVQDAMMMGLPVVVSPLHRMAGLGQLSYGYLADAEDPVAFAQAIQELKANPQIAEAKGLAGQRRAQQEFSLGAVGATLDRVYTTVCG